MRILSAKSPVPRASLRHALAVIAAAIALVSISPFGSFGARVAAAEPKFEVAAGLRGWFDPGDHVVVAATVTSDDLLDGRIDVVTQTGARVTREVQVAGGTSKTFLLVVPTGLDGSALDVRLYRDGELSVRRSVPMKVAEQVELVGVLPALVTRVGELPEQTNLATDTGKAQLAELSLEQMALGTAALDVFDTIAATSADLGSLQPAPRAALLGWLNRGGRLLLDDSGDLSTLPAEWRPGAAGYSLAGRGEVRLLNGAATAGQWASIVQPSAMSSTENNQFFGGEQLGTVQQDLARRAGVKLPSMLPLLVPLVVYWFVVSVVLFLVLKASRRLTLAWIAIPLLAALTAGGVLVFGDQWRSAGKPSATLYVDGYPGGGDGMLSLLTFSRNGGTASATLPAGWQSESELTTMFGFAEFSITVAPQVIPTSDATQVKVRLEAGQVATATLAGPTTDSGLRAVAHVDGASVVGTVTNEGPITLTQVAVFAPGGAQLIGSLAPGASAPFSLRADSLPQGFSLADRVWKSVDRPGHDPADLAEYGIWTNASTSRVMYPSGLVRVAGWTDERPSEASMSGGLTSVAVVTELARIEPGTGPLPAASVRTSSVRSPFTQFGNGTADSVYRYLLPPETQLGKRLVVSLPVGIDSIDMWNGSAWVPTSAIKRLITIPPNFVQQGVVMLRIANNGQFFSDAIPVVRGATPKDTA